MVLLFRAHGHLSYDGEGVTQLEHAWQCGQLALQANALPALQLAAWLHDAGHLVTGLGDTPTLQGVDDRHEESGARLLSSHFPEAVFEPVRWHVEAKRYMVASIPGYRARLSADSVRSLALQGGPMSPEECQRFEANPHCMDAQRLRVWDDVSKRMDWPLVDEERICGELQTLIARVLQAA
ncbi:HD domain-containing protein [Rhodoferax saidenbachensis]|nr:HD domain-containing protein [Rhodoferax saidenbachensis]